MKDIRKLIETIDAPLLPPNRHARSGVRQVDDELLAENERLRRELTAARTALLERQEALKELVKTREAEAKAEMTLTTAMNNYTEFDAEQQAYDTAARAVDAAWETARRLTNESNDASIPLSDSNSNSGTAI
jgi:Skp family chaperone for outer membrane proteins